MRAAPNPTGTGGRRWKRSALAAYAAQHERRWSRGQHPQGNERPERHEERRSTPHRGSGAPAGEHARTSPRTRPPRRPHGHQGAAAHSSGRRRSPRAAARQEGAPPPQPTSCGRVKRRSAAAPPTWRGRAAAHVAAPRGGLTAAARPPRTRHGRRRSLRGSGAPREHPPARAPQEGETPQHCSGATTLIALDTTCLTAYGPRQGACPQHPPRAKLRGEAGP